MSTEKTEALVIRQADFSESSRVVTFFTADFGKVSALAKGAKRLKGPFDSALDLLARCRIVFLRKSSGSLHVLTEAESLQQFRPSGRDLIGLYGGYYVAELIAALTEEEDPHRILFDEAVAALSRLADGDRPELSLLRFELSVLRESGQLPAFDFCVACATPLENQDPLAFWVSQGGLICPRCQKQEYRQNSIRSGTAAMLRRLSDASQRIDRLSVPPGQLSEMRRVVTAAISHALGRRPRMYRYLPF